jgi:hypothetical protein
MSKSVVLAVTVLSLMIVPVRARAQERVAADPATVVSLLSSSAGLPAAAAAESDPFRVRTPAPRPSVETARTGWSPVLASLYVSTGLMQALDLHSTYRALGRGAVEANPVVTGLIAHPAAFIGMKAAMATAAILSARHVASRNRAAAILTLAATNTAYALVVDHNYRLARGLR